MIQTNWHTHTKRCGHAEGEDEAYVQAAVKAGLKILGFSDHAPYPIPTPGDCMPIELYEDYVSSMASAPMTSRKKNSSISTLSVWKKPAGMDSAIISPTRTSACGAIRAWTRASALWQRRSQICLCAMICPWNSTAAAAYATMAGAIMKTVIAMPTRPGRCLKYLPKRNAR